MTTIGVYYKGEWTEFVRIMGGVQDYAIIDMAMAIDADPSIPHENVAIYDTETEEIWWSADEGCIDDEPADIDSDMGYDPYMGCFSDDC